MGSMQQKHNDRAIIHLDVADFAVAVERLCDPASEVDLNRPGIAGDSES